MTPLQAYELASMFGMRKRLYIQEIGKYEQSLAQPGEDTPAAERADKDMRITLACRNAALQELKDLEGEVRRTLGLTALAQEQGGSDA